MKKYKLRDLLSLKNGRDHKHLANGPYPVYGSGGLMRMCDGYLYDSPSILLPRKGTLDNIQYVDVPFWTVDTTYYTEVDSTKVNPYYLYRYLRLLDLSNLDSGTGVPSMTFESYYNIEVLLPELHVQNKVAKILQSIDSKIALNREINRNLEAMARQHYDYWFLQFDFPDENGKPYKSSGGRMVWNEKLKREIPEHWQVRSLPDIAVFTNGIACQKFRPEDDNAKLPVIKIREMRDGITEDSEWVKSDIPESVRVHNGDILFSWSASLEVMIWCSGEGGLNQHIFKVSSKNHYPKPYIFFQILDYIDVFKSIAEARKTTMGHITQDHLNQSAIATPDNFDVLKHFEEKVMPMFQQYVSNNEEITLLKKKRDELLPLLMNGQVSVMPTEVNCDLSE